jgi:hypothetical protein
MHKEISNLRKFICKKCKQEKLACGGSQHFVCNGCKPTNHYTFSKQYQAQKAVNQARKNGLLRPATDFDCVDCGGQATEYDHRDYDKPLMVDPVCRRCNLTRGPAVNWQRTGFVRHI